MIRTIVVNPIEPAPLSLRAALGIDLDLSLTLKSQAGPAIDPTPLYPQLALMPRSSSGVYAYDMPTIDAAKGTCGVTVPGTALVDTNGLNVEVYFRKLAVPPTDPKKPTALAAKGVLSLQGSSYQQLGPLGMINVPVVVGPQGEPGPTGPRGSLWFTGSGDPGSITGAIDGDLYLDTANGNVWRFNGASWALR